MEKLGDFDRRKQLVVVWLAPELDVLQEGGGAGSQGAPHRLCDFLQGEFAFRLGLCAVKFDRARRFELDRTKLPQIPVDFLPNLESRDARHLRFAFLTLRVRLIHARAHLRLCLLKGRP